MTTALSCLPETGSGNQMVVLLALALVVAGTTAVLLARARRRREGLAMFGMAGLLAMALVVAGFAAAPPASAGEDCEPAPTTSAAPSVTPSPTVASSSSATASPTATATVRPTATITPTAEPTTTAPTTEPPACVPAEVPALAFDGYQLTDQSLAAPTPFLAHTGAAPTSVSVTVGYFFNYSVTVRTADGLVTTRGEYSTDLPGAVLSAGGLLTFEGLEEADNAGGAVLEAAIEDAASVPGNSYSGSGSGSLLRATFVLFDGCESQTQVVEFNRGGGGIGGGGGGISDIRLKTDVTLLETTASGFNIYSFRYIADPSTLWVGVMAQDLLISHPEALIVRPDGFYAVRYDLLGLQMITYEAWAAGTSVELP